MYTELLGVSEALQRLLSHFKPLPAERISLSDALWRVLAEDVIAPHPLPPFDNSSMDGYAARARDLVGASGESPIELNVIGDISAGVVVDKPLGKLTAMRIMTGAPLPPGADCVVPVENTLNPNALVNQELEKTIKVFDEVQEGDYIRRAGNDVVNGRQVLDKGHRLWPPDIGMLAALGVPAPLVHGRPKVALLSTGDELVDVSQGLQPGFIRDSNGYSLAAAVESAHAIPLRMGIVPDEAQIIEEKMDDAVSSGADLIVSSAGVSMGAYDFVRSVIEKRGVLEFWRINIRPGKPLLFGYFDEVPVLGLPGNPVSALVTFEIFVRRVLDTLSGVSNTKKLSIHAHLGHDIKSDGRESYLRARVEWVDGNYRANLVGSQDSGVLSSLVLANALIIIPEGVQSLARESIVEVWLLDK